MNLNKQNNFFKLFANCIPVKGVKRSLIYDLQFGNYLVITNFLHDLLIKSRDLTISQIFEHFNNELNDPIMAALRDLETRNVGFFTDSKENFPDLELTWESPSFISNAIIEFDYIKSPRILIEKLSELGCESLFLNINSKIEISVLKNVLKLTRYTRIKSIQVSILFNPQLQNEELINFCKKELIFSHIIIYNSPQNQVINANNPVIISTVSNTEQLSNQVLINQNYFTVNLNLFAEARTFNPYFNRKIYVGENNEIKNAPECSEVFGTFDKNIELKEIIKSDSFRKYWDVNKDRIAICQDCEYRYMCIDNRLPVKKEDNFWYYISECNYNPYITKWKNEEGYVSVKECNFDTLNP